MGVNVKRVYSGPTRSRPARRRIAGASSASPSRSRRSTGTAYLVTGFAVVVLGGVGSVKGTLIGGLVLGVIESIGATFVGDGWRVFIGCVVVLIVLSIRPQGLFGTVEGQ